MQNKLALRPTGWKTWYFVLALIGFFVGSQAALLLQLADGLPPAAREWLTALAPLAQFIASALLALALVGLAARRWPTAPDLGLSARLSGRDIVLLLVVFVVTHGFFWLLSWGHEDPGQAARLFADMNLGKGLLSDAGVLVSGVILAPVCEEIVYRGLILRTIHDGLARKWPPRLAAAVALWVSALAFALPHLGDELLGRLGLAYLASGLAFGLVYVWTGSLTAAMVSHSLQSCWAFGNILLLGRGDAHVSPLLYVLVFGCPLWVYLCARGLRAVLPQAAWREQWVQVESIRCGPRP